MHIPFPISKLCEIGVQEKDLPSIIPGWEKSQQKFSTTPNYPFLEINELSTSREYCRMDEQIDSSLIRCASAIEKHPIMLRFAWHCWFQFVEDREVKSFSEWPTHFTSLNEDSGVFYLLMALGIVPLIRSKYQSMGIPEDIIRDTCLEIKGFCGNHQVCCDSRPGIIPSQLAWLRNYIDGKLFRLGRMEYKLESVAGFGEVYRNRETREMVALSQADIKYNGQGYVDGTGDIWDETGSWKSILLDENDKVTGNPIDPTGQAISKTLTLKKSEWELVLKEGDTFIDLHIPPGGGLKPEICLDSFQRAVQFFSEFFPERPAKAIMCRSWIFNPAWEEKMRESNLAKLIRELYLFPIPCSGKDGIFFVFCREFDDLSQAPRKTSLQRAMLEILESGQVLRSSGMFILSEDLQYFGQEHYRKTYRSGVENA